MSDAPEPVPNEIERPYWDAAMEERLMLQRCNDCDIYTYPPRIGCPNCFGELRWEEVSGHGRVYTFGVVHRPSSPAYFDQHVPYVLSVVELDEGPRVLTHLVGIDPANISIGQSVTVTFEQPREEFRLPVFEPA